MLKNNVPLQCKWLGKETKPKASIMREIKIRADINEMDNRKTAGYQWN